LVFRDAKEREEIVEQPAAAPPGSWRPRGTPQRGCQRRFIRRPTRL